MKRQSFNYLRWTLFIVLIVFAWFNYYGMFQYSIYMFNKPDEDMSHGWAVPFVSAYAIWSLRKRFAQVAGAPSARGLVWVVISLVLAWIGGRGGQLRIEQLSFIGLVWAIPYAFWGKGVAHLMLFPAGYLLFTIPLTNAMDFFTIYLRLFSSGTATAILNGFGMAIERSGTALFSRIPGREFNVDVADPCSGIRSLFAMMALTVAYGHYTLKTRTQKCFLFACSIPIAVIGNMFRIFSICLIASLFGQNFAMGYYHDYSGYFIFVVAVLLMFQAAHWTTSLDEWLRSRYRWFDKLFTQGRLPDHQQLQSPANTPYNNRQAYLIVVLTTLLIGAMFAALMRVGPPIYDNTRFICDALPEQLGNFTSDKPWFCHNDQCAISFEEKELITGHHQNENGFICPSCKQKMYTFSLGEKTLLPADTLILKRIYKSSDGLIYSVSVVLSGKSRASIHRAEMCLPAQGFVMLSAETRALHTHTGRPKEVRIIQAQRSFSNSRFSLVYWFASRDRECSSHFTRIWYDIWDRSIHNRINRWAMIAVNVSSPLDTPETSTPFEAFVDELYQKILLQ
jgi:exosortase